MTKLTAQLVMAVAGTAVLVAWFLPNAWLEIGVVLVTFGVGGTLLAWIARAVRRDQPDYATSDATSEHMERGS